MTNEFARLDVVLGADSQKIREHLGTPTHRGMDLEIFRRGDYALALFYQPTPEGRRVSALMLYGEENQTIYTSGLTPMSLSAYHLISRRLDLRDEACDDSAQPEAVTVEWLRQMCGAPAAVEGSGIPVWIYGTQFGALACFTVLAGQVTGVTLVR